jgi:hypothetical protein
MSYDHRRHLLHLQERRGSAVYGIVRMMQRVDEFLSSENPRMIQ